MAAQHTVGISRQPRDIPWPSAFLQGEGEGEGRERERGEGRRERGRERCYDCGHSQFLPLYLSCK